LNAPDTARRWIKGIALGGEAAAAKLRFDPSN
jgi:hypothetical protein